MDNLLHQLLLDHALDKGLKSLMEEVERAVVSYDQDIADSDELDYVDTYYIDKVMVSLAALTAPEKASPN